MSLTKHYKKLHIFTCLVKRTLREERKQPQVLLAFFFFSLPRFTPSSHPTPERMFEFNSVHFSPI